MGWCGRSEYGRRRAPVPGAGAVSASSSCQGASGSVSDVQSSPISSRSRLVFETAPQSCSGRGSPRRIAAGSGGHIVRCWAPASWLHSRRFGNIAARVAVLRWRYQKRTAAATILSGIPPPQPASHICVAIHRAGRRSWVGSRCVFSPKCEGFGVAVFRSLERLGGNAEGRRRALDYVEGRSFSHPQARPRLTLRRVGGT